MMNVIQRAPEIGKRAYYAAIALQGMLASSPMCDRSAVNKRAWTKVAFEWADAMIYAETFVPRAKRKLK